VKAEMALFGTFDTMPLADLVQWIIDSRSSGRLVVTVETDETFLLFRDGDLTGVSSGDSLRLDFGQYLLAHGAIVPEVLQRTASAGIRGSALKKALLEDGTLEQRRLVTLEQQYALEILLDLFFFVEGSFHFAPVTAKTPFFDSAAQDEGLLEQPISTRNALMEAMRRLDEWRRIKEVFPSGFTVVSAVGEGGEDDPVWKTLRELKTPVAVSDLCVFMGVNRFSVYQRLYRLHGGGRIRIDEMNPGRANYAELGPMSTLVVNARLLIEEQQFEEAREVLSTILGLEPENREARALFKTLRESQLQYLYRQIPPHRTPVLTLSRAELATRSLSHRELYLAERLNGKWDVGMLVVATPLGELDTLRILRKLLHAGLVKLM